jgi:hypothetical protein
MGKLDDPRLLEPFSLHGPAVDAMREHVAASVAKFSGPSASYWNSMLTPEARVALAELESMLASPRPATPHA